MIRFSDVSFDYRRAAAGATALSGVSLELAPGEVVAVLGSNGSGKSTLAKLANGLLLPSAGTVVVDDIDSKDGDRIQELRQRVSVVFQRPDNQIVATSVEDDVAFGPENLGLPRDEIRRRVDDSLAHVGLSGLERREPHLLSGGQKQRLAIAGALAMRPEYLILDEPTSMLDPEGRRAVLEIIEGLRASRRGILHITHDLADAATADRVLVLSGGAIVFEGTAAKLVVLDTQLAEWGLEAPPIAVLAAELARLGVPLADGAVGVEMVLESLCP